MKRTIAAIEALLDDLLEPLDVADTHRLCERYRDYLDSRYREKTLPYTERFMRVGGDVFTEHVLEDNLSRGINAIPVFEMATLRLVCKRWAEWVAQIKHLTLGSNCWAGSIYGIVISPPLFSQVTSITSHQRILLQSCDEFSRITSLVIALPGYNDERELGDIDLSQWSSLRTFEASHCFFEMEGLAALTTLTRLNVQGEAFGNTMQSHYQLTQLTNLRHLEVRAVARDVPLVECLTMLTYLRSDQPHHFIDYTGAGELQGSPVHLAMLHCDDASLDDDEGLALSAKALPILQADYALYQAGCHYATLEGRWDCGVFSGHAWLRYHVVVQKQEGEGEKDEKWTYHTFDGGMVDGKRDGRGYEYEMININDDREAGKVTGNMFHGRWYQGYRHGMGVVGRCTTQNDFKENFVPLAFETWQHGTLISSISIDEMRMACDNGGVPTKVNYFLSGVAHDIVELDEECMQEIDRALNLLGV